MTPSDAEDEESKFEAILAMIPLKPIGGADAAADQTPDERVAWLSAFDAARRDVTTELGQLRAQLNALEDTNHARARQFEAIMQSSSWDTELIRTLSGAVEQDNDEAGLLKAMIAEYSAFDEELERVRNRILAEGENDR